MDDKITGAIAVVIAVLYLGHMAFGIGAIPLIIIVCIGVALLVTDYVQSVRKSKKSGGQ